MFSGRSYYQSKKPKSYCDTVFASYETMTSAWLKIDPLQEVCIRVALQNHKGGCVWTSPTSEPDGPDVGTWLFTSRHMHHIHESGRQPTKLTFSANQLRQNLRHKGGFLSLLARGLIPIIESAVGAVVEREIAGGSIHVSHLTVTFSTKPCGEGLYLGLYLGCKPRRYRWFQGEKNVRFLDVRHPDWYDLHQKILKNIM